MEAVLRPGELMRDLRAELMVVEPSAAFAAGVRARVGGDGAGLRFCVGVAAAAVVACRGRRLLAGAARSDADGGGKSHPPPPVVGPGAYGSMHRLPLGPVR